MKSIGALAPLNLARSSSVDGNFGIAAFVPSRSMKVGQLNFFWKFSSFGWNCEISNGEPTYPDWLFL